MSTTFSVVQHPFYRCQSVKQSLHHSTYVVRLRFTDAFDLLWTWKICR